MRVAKNRRDTSVPPTMSKPIGKVTHSPSLAESTVSSMTSSAAVLISDWGFPGYLSADEFTAFELFREEVARRDQTFRSAIFSFGFEEDESYALCRWLRSRKFNAPDTIKMVEEAVEVRKEPSKQNFFPEPKAALGVEVSIYAAQYPQVYCGVSRTGCPVYFSKPGELNISGLECITTMEGILRYHWYGMIHEFSSLLKAQKKADPSFQRYECICVLDLANLTASQVNKRALNIIKSQSTIDSVCFPEILSRMVILNAPSFFCMTWTLIKGWIDARTASKIDIISSRRKGEKRLLELVMPEQLPSDYGGKADTTVVSLEKELRENGCSRQVTQVLSVRSNATMDLNLDAGESMQLSVFTRSLTETVFNVINLASSKAIMSNVAIKHLGEGDDDEPPTRVILPEVLTGPGQFKIKAESTGYFSSENFLIAGVVVNKKIKKPQKAKENVPPSIARKPLHDQCKGAAQSPQATVQVCRDHQADGGSLADISLSSTRKRQVSHSNNRELTKEAPKPNSVPLAQEDKQETRLEVGVKETQHITTAPSEQPRRSEAPAYTMVEPDKDNDLCTGWSCGMLSISNIFGMFRTGS